MKQFSTIHIFEGSDVRYLGVGTEVISLLPPKV
jgi:hypothetical protein